MTPAHSFYARFVQPGDLVFDIGANLGNRTDTFVDLGARVVAVEPQAELAAQLRARYANNPDVTVLDCALSDSAGEAEMMISDAHTLSTLETSWVENMQASGRFAGHSWNERRVVKTRTLASVVEEFGAPAFCKIDVEGFEATVLAGLDRAVTACSLEFASENWDGLRRSLDRLASLGPVECNYSEGESMELARPDWISPDDLMDVLTSLPGHLPWGDVYIRAAQSQPAEPPSFIAFSKDRPAQLELLLRSMARFAPGADVSVVYTASEPLYDRGYALVRDEYPWIRFVDERTAGGFKTAMLNLARAAGNKLAFLVDDIVFTHPLEPAGAPLRALDEDPEVMACSLRLDRNKDYCYALDRPMRIPLAAGSTTWEWRGLAGDWGYPMSADGHVFRRDEILPLLERLHYVNPNSLEEQLSQNALPQPKLTCFETARLVNVPDNRVQDTARNRHSGGDPRRLTQQFLEGRRLDLAPFDGLVTNAVHHEMPLRFALDGSEPRVSVVIPCHNMATTLAEAVHSVWNSHFDGDAEVIVVDDGSTDSSADVARELGVKLIQQPASGHPAHARNAGFAAASAPYVLPLDADDRIASGFLAATVAALDANPGAGFAYGDELDFGAGDDVLHRTPPYDFAALTQKNFIGSATLIRREAFEAVGGYDAEVGYEDWDLWIALGDAAWHGVKAEGAVFEHRVSDGRWASDIGHDREIKARFVLKRPELYSDAQRRWAAGVLEGDALAVAVPDVVGTIPSSATLPGPTPIDAKAHAIAAAAHELAANPELLSAYGRAFGPDDDVTLVIYADSRPEAIAGMLEPAIETAGLATPDAPDLLAVPGPASVAMTVAQRSSAVLSRGAAPAEFSDLPRFDDANVNELRRSLLGDDFEVPADMAWAFGEDGFYEKEVTYWFDKLVEKVAPKVVYDIGANCGWFAVRADRAGAAVRAFEPVPGTADVLERNLRRARDARVTRAAVGAEPGTALMHLDSSSGNNSLVERSLPAGHPLRHEVEILTLDDLVGTDGFPVPELIKIDVDGFELPVLQGARETLRKHHPALLLEWSETTCRDAGYDRHDLITELNGLGYKVKAIAAAETLIATAPSVELEPRSMPLDPHERFRAELEIYRSMEGAGAVCDEDLNPQLDDRTPTTPFDQHYFYQDIWAARRVAEIQPERHVDVGSRIDYVGFLTAICPVTFVDIRPLEVDIENFECITGTILDMPFPDQSLESVSCLHVAEHIGLGRYGDPLDPLGTRKAAAELQRVLAPGGSLLFSGPVGRGRTCFNAHRVHDVDAVVEEFFPELELVEFSGVDDRGVFRRHRDLAELRGSNYACGMYQFKRPR